MATVYFLAMICGLRVDSGPCRAAFRMWYYDGVSGRCRIFLYGGCSGNANRFNSEHDCLQMCGPHNATGEVQVTCMLDH